MKFKKEYHIRFGKELQMLRDTLLILFTEFHNNHTKKTYNPYEKAYKLIESLRSRMDNIEFLEYKTIKCYYVAKGILFEGGVTDDKQI